MYYALEQLGGLEINNIEDHVILHGFETLDERNEWLWVNQIHNGIRIAREAYISEPLVLYKKICAVNADVIVKPGYHPSVGYVYHGVWPEPYCEVMDE